MWKKHGTIRQHNDDDDGDDMYYAVHMFTLLSHNDFTHILSMMHLF